MTGGLVAGRVRQVPVPGPGPAGDSTAIAVYMAPSMALPCKHKICYIVGCINLSYFPIISLNSPNHNFPNLTQLKLYNSIGTYL